MLLRLVVVLSPLGSAAGADLEDPRAYGLPGYGRHGSGPPERGPIAPHHPPRVVTRQPGYVGSDYGLGKPAFTGLGSRPDWGRSGE